MNTLHANLNYLTSKLLENLIDRLEFHVFRPIKYETTGEFLYKSKNEVYTPVTFKEIDKHFLN